MLALLIIVAIGSLVCWIVVLTKIFPDSVGLGILGVLCPLFTFIYGWTKAAEWGIQKVMLIWTGLIVAQIILRFAAGPMQ